MRTMTEGLLCVIPARGGSRRVPRKAVRPLLGQPAIGYTIAAAIESELFSRVIVTTDDEEIATIATGFGAEVPFLRDPALSDDETPVSAATVDALHRLDPDGDRYAAVVQLMVTCPLRTAADVRSSYLQFAATNARSQISVTRFGWQNPWWAMRRGEASYVLEPLFQEAAVTRSQDLPELYCTSGAIWWARAETLRRTGTYHIPGRTGWEIPWQRGIDVDTEDDWRMAELLLRLQAERRDAVPA